MMMMGIGTPISQSRPERMMSSLYPGLELGNEKIVPKNASQWTGRGIAACE
jgi:hypothetical protein